MKAFSELFGDEHNSKTIAKRVKRLLFFAKGSHKTREVRF